MFHPSIPSLSLLQPPLLKILNIQPESGSQGPVLILKEEISKLKAVMAKLEESLSKANKSLLKCKLKIADGDDEANVDIASIKTQVDIGVVRIGLSFD